MKTLVINFPALVTGGVENICFSLMRYSIDQGYRVIWLHGTPIRIADAFHDFVSAKVEMVPVWRSMTGRWVHGGINFVNGEEVTVLSFTPFDMDNALKLMEEFSEVNITPIYMVANTRGRYYFIEEYYFGGLRKLLFKFIRKLMENWVDMDAVRFCAEGQVTAFEQHYGLQIKDHKHVLFKEVTGPPELDEVLLKRKANREIFNMLSISRFDFPHKAYLLGLIRSYGHLKERYKNLRLHIIGYGPSKARVTAEIGKLSVEAQSDVILYGEVSKDAIPAMLDEMHLNISVAGSVGVAAECGVLSIPARNFCETECEVYGFLPEARFLATSTEPGFPVEPFIEQVMNMSDNEYIQKCRDSYLAYKDVDVDPEWIFKQQNHQGAKPVNMHTLLDRMYVFRDYAYKIGLLLSRG